MKRQYIVINDSKGNDNIWKIISETDNTYIIKTRSTKCEIEKEFRFDYKDSILKYAEGIIIDIDDSNIELESQEEYELWLCNCQYNYNNV